MDCKVFLIALCLFALFDSIVGQPLNIEEDGSEGMSIDSYRQYQKYSQNIRFADTNVVVVGEETHGLRQKRATCDLLSINIMGNSLNHAACAAHCLAKGRKGGRCNSNAVCVCRR